MLDEQISAAYDKATQTYESAHIEEVLDRVMPVVHLARGLATCPTRDQIKRDIIGCIDAIRHARAEPEKWGEWKPNNYARTGPISVSLLNADPENYEVHVSAGVVYGMTMWEREDRGD